LGGHTASVSCFLLLPFNRLKAGGAHQSTNQKNEQQCSPLQPLSVFRVTDGDDPVVIPPEMLDNKLWTEGICNLVPGKETKDGRNRKKMVLELKEEDLEEKFVRSTGKGGQKVNKSSSKVSLTHLPTGLQVQCQDARDMSTNRERARKYLLEKLDFYYNKENSKLAIEQERVRKGKQERQR
jgi:hypothetical protein